MEESGGRTTIVKQGRSVLITIPSRWQIKEDPQRSSILGREINPDSALAIIKTIYEISFSTSKSSDERSHENCGKFKMSISVSDFKQRHPNLTSKNRTKLNSDINSVASLLSGEFGLKNTTTDQWRVPQVSTKSIVDISPPPNIHSRICSGPAVYPTRQRPNNPWPTRTSARRALAWGPMSGIHHCTGHHYKSSDCLCDSSQKLRAKLRIKMISAQLVRYENCIIRYSVPSQSYVYPVNQIPSIKTRPSKPDTQGSKLKVIASKFPKFPELGGTVHNVNTVKKAISSFLGPSRAEGPPNHISEISSAPGLHMGRSPNIVRNGTFEYPRPKCFNPSISHMNVRHDPSQACPPKGNSWPRVPTGFTNIHTGDGEVDEYINRNLRQSSQINAPPPGMEPTGPDFGSTSAPWSNLEGSEWSNQPNTLSTDPMSSSLYESISKYDVSNVSVKSNSDFNTQTSRAAMHDHLTSPQPPTNALPSSASNNNLSSMMKNSNQQHQHHQSNQSQIGTQQPTLPPSHRRTSSWTGSSGFQFSNLDGIGLS